MTQANARTLTYLATEADRGERLDRVLATVFPEFSRARLQALIKDGQVQIGGVAVREAKTPVKSGQIVTLAVPESQPAVPTAEAIALDIVYEDKSIIVIDKPAGLVVHPAAGHWTGTLVNALIHHCGESLSGIGGVKRPGIVHRLDKDTSGLLVIAKTDRAHKALAAQFKDHGRTGPLERIYQAFVWGLPERTQGTIDKPIGRSTSNRLKRAIGGADAKEAITHYAVAESYGASVDNGRRKAVASLLECALETGRTHQIRVHLAHLGHPVLGDAAYGAHFSTKLDRLPDALAHAIRALPGQALHAAVLGFAHPITDEELHFEAPLPPTLTALIAALQDLR